MKKALSEVNMTESESQVVRQTMKQGILNVQILSVSIVETSSEESIPYAEISNVQPSEPKRKSERLVEVVTTVMPKI